MLGKIIILAALISALGAGQAAASDLWPVGRTFVVRAEAAELEQPAGRADFLQDIERAAHRACRHERPRVARERCEVEQSESMAAQLAPSARRLLDLGRAERGQIRLAATE